MNILVLILTTASLSPRHTLFTIRPSQRKTKKRMIRVITTATRIMITILRILE